MSRGTMGLVAPLAAVIGAGIPALIGLVSGEPVGPVLLVGIAAALGAVVIISLPDAPATSSGPASDRPGRRGELLLVLAAGLGFAAFFLGVDQSRSAGGETWWPIMIVRVAGLIAVGSTILLLSARGRAPSLRIPRRLLPLCVLAGLGDLGGNLFFIIANDSGELAVAVVTSSLYPVVTALLARFFLGERLSRVRIGGVILATVAIALIALGRA
ncbi:MAG: EamA family transporter [Chloroflexi bacterium]|nr:EamA family transporter [Chloroflexota bacterium]